MFFFIEDTIGNSLTDFPARMSKLPISFPSLQAMILPIICPSSTGTEIS